MHLCQRPVTGQPLQKITQVHIVSELPEEFGLGRIVTGANLDQLGVVHENQGRQVGTLFFESAPSLPRTDTGSSVLPYLLVS